MPSGLNWTSNYYHGRVHGVADMAMDPTGDLVVTMTYALASSFRPGQKLILKFKCLRDETMCYARSQNQGQLMLIAIPLNGKLIGRYISLGPIDRGQITVGISEVEMIRKSVPLSSDPLVEPEEFKQVYSAGTYGTGCCLL